MRTYVQLLIYLYVYPNINTLITACVVNDILVGISYLIDIVID